MIWRFEEGKTYRFIGNINNIGVDSGTEAILNKKLHCVEANGCLDEQTCKFIYRDKYGTLCTTGLWNLSFYDGWDLDWIQVDEDYNEDTKMTMRLLGINIHKIKTTYKKLK